VQSIWIACKNKVFALLIYTPYLGFGVRVHPEGIHPEGHPEPTFSDASGIRIPEAGRHRHLLMPMHQET